jgi:hypothetical protein
MDRSKRWTWQVADKKVVENLLYDHVSNHPIHGQKEMIMKALVAFYGPLACMQDPTLSPVHRNEIYKSARHDLQRQLEILDSAFHEQPETTPVVIEPERRESKKPAPPQLSFSALME